MFEHFGQLTAQDVLKQAEPIIETLETRLLGVLNLQTDKLAVMVDRLHGAAIGPFDGDIGGMPFHLDPIVIRLPKTK